jgi:hypothetical protein
MFFTPCEHVRKTTEGQLWEFRKSPCDYSERPFCAINLLIVSKIGNIAHHSVQVIHMQHSQLHIKMSSNHNAVLVSIRTVAIQYELLQFCTPSPCFMPFCFNALSKLHQFLICPLIFSLMPFSWLHSIMLNP